MFLIWSPHSFILTHGMESPSPYVYGMKLCNMTSDPNECVIFFFKDRVGKPIFMHLLLKIKVFPENMGMMLDKTYELKAYS